MNKKLIKAAVIGALFSVAPIIYAADEVEDIKAPSMLDEFSFSANVGLYSDYIFRGYTQTQNEPAIQGGFDVEHSSGLYAGTWASNVDWTTAGDYMDKTVLKSMFMPVGLEILVFMILVSILVCCNFTTLVTRLKAQSMLTQLKFILGLIKIGVHFQQALPTML